MARVAYTDLFLNFDPNTTNKPTIANIGTLITTYYQQCYEATYGFGQYADPDDATSDPETIIRSSEFAGILIAELSKKVQQWHDSGMNSSGEVIVMPNFLISKQLDKKCKAMYKHATKGTRIVNIRIFGSEYDDAGVI